MAYILGKYFYFFDDYLLKIIILSWMLLYRYNFLALVVIVLVLSKLKKADFIFHLCSQMWMIVVLHLVRMVQSVWINMVATHVSALISGVVKTVQVYCILILAGYTCNPIGYTGMCEILNMFYSSLSLLSFPAAKIPKNRWFSGMSLGASVVHLCFY